MIENRPLLYLQLLLSVILLSFLFTDKNLLGNPGFETSSIKKDNGDFKNCPPWRKIGGQAFTDVYDFGEDYSLISDSVLRNNLMLPKKIQSNAKQDLGKSFLVLAVEGRHTDKKTKAFYRGYVQAKIPVPLIKGKKYNAGFLAAFIPSFSTKMMNGIGLLFTTEPGLRPDSNNLIIAKPQVYAKNIILTTNELTLIQGDFIALDNYEWVTIGNFLHPDSLLSTPFEPIQMRDPQMKYVVLRNEHSRYMVDNLFLIEQK